MEYKELQRLIRAKKIRVKIGMLICSKDKFGNETWSIEQIPIIKR